MKKTYAEQGDACATAHALELVGDRWNYPVLRELMLAPKRFNELLPSVRGITPTVLTTRLRYLEESGVARKVYLAAPARVSAYELTEWGHQLEPILRELGRWAQSSPTRTHQGGLTPDAAIQSMLTMAPSGGINPDIELAMHLFDARIQEDHGYDYRISWGVEGLVAERGTNPVATAWVNCDSSIWANILYDALPLNDSGVLIQGKRNSVRRFIDHFIQPPPYAGLVVGA